MQTYSEHAPTGFDSKGLNLPDQQHWLVLPCGRNRDSDHLTESNFQTALDMLGGESDTVEVHAFNHWACGWFEIILIDPDSPAEAVARDIESSLSDYPVLDDEDYSKREYDGYNESWSSGGAREFVNALVRKFNLSDDQDDALTDLEDSEALQSFFEGLNECGDYHDDGVPNVRRSVAAATRDDVLTFLADNTKPEQT